MEAIATCVLGGAAVKAFAEFGGPKPGSWRVPSPDEISPYDDADSVPVYVTGPADEMPIRVAKVGVASMKPTTIPHLFALAASRHPDKDALKVQRGGEWKTWTWKEYYADSQRAARGFMAFGLQLRECVNIIGFNSPEWFLAQMGAILAGGKAAGVYTTNEAAACKYVAEHSEAKVIVVEDVKQLNKYLSFRSELPLLQAIVMWNEEVPSSANADGEVPVLSWSGFLGCGTSVDVKELQVRSEATRPGHCASLIYTSGTTGHPKAVMMSHDNFIFESAAVYEHLCTPIKDKPDNFRVVSYLPLSHVAAQMIDIIFPVIVTALLGEDAAHIHQTVWFAKPDALKGTLKDTLVAARPTLFLGVPRVWEKIRESMLEIGRATTGAKKAIATWAKEHAALAAKERQLGGSGARTVAYMLAKKVLLGKIKEALGLDQCIICLSGAAPISNTVTSYFASLDLDILEVYGMSESTGGTTLNTPAIHQLGTVGPPVTPIEVKIDHVEGRDNPGEGEVCYRGRSIMMGYMKEEAKTKAAIDKAGWLHSGDVGRMDENHLLRITGRLKELIITAGGENIAPVPIEDTIKALCPAISNAMMIGDKRKYNVMLLTVKTVIDPETTLSTGELTGDAARVDPSVATADEVVKASQTKGSIWAKYLQDGFDELNSKHMVSNAQKVQKFTVVPGEFTEAGGELTATLKLKRGPTEAKYADVIEQMYS